MVIYLNENIINEGLSKTIYHFTSLHNLLEIMNSDNMYLQSGIRGGGADSKSNNKLFYLCFTRVSDGRFGYSRNRNVRIEFDGESLSYNYSGKPIDYWGETMGKQYYFKNAQEDNKIIDYTQPNTENEDRLFSKEPVIRDVSKYIKRIDILVNENEEQEMGIAYKLCYKSNIFIYNNQKDFNAKNNNTINEYLQANFDKFGRININSNKINSKRVTQEGVTDAVNFILFWECKPDELKKNAALLLKQYGLEKYATYVIKNIGKTWFIEDVINSFSYLSDKMLSDGIQEDYVLTMQMLRDYCLKHNITDRYSAFRYKKSLQNKSIQNNYGHEYYAQLDYDKTLTTLAYIMPHNDNLNIDENGIARHLYGVTLILYPEKDSVWGIKYLNENVKYLFEDGGLSYYVNSHNSKDDEYFKKYLKHLSMDNNFTVNDFINFVKNVDMEEESKKDWLLYGGRFEQITVNCSNCTGKYPDCSFISDEERKEVEQYFVKLNEDKQQKKVYINEDKLQLLKEDYYDISQIKHNDEFYTWQDWNTFPFFYTYKGEIIIGDEATTHDDSDYEDYFDTDFSKGFGRIFITNEQDIIIIVSALSYDEKLTDIEAKHIVSKVLDKFKCDLDKVYYIDPYGNNKELKKYLSNNSNPKQRNLGNMTLAQYHSLIYQENKQQKKVYINEDKLQLLQEGYSSKNYQDEILKIGEELYNDIIKNNKNSSSTKFENSTISFPIYLSIAPKENAWKNNRGVFVNITTATTLNTIQKLLMHEFTHMFDKVKDKETNFKQEEIYEKLYNSYDIPKYIADVIYHLWIPTEFNAFQVTYDYEHDDFNHMFEDYMEKIKQAYEFPTTYSSNWQENYQKIWERIRDVLIKHIPNKYHKCNIDKFKKYFVENSLALLKKLVKKWNGKQNVNFENKKLENLLKENISSVVYHFTDFNSFAKIAETNALKMSRTNAYAEADNDLDRNIVNNEINGKYNYYISFTRSPNSKLGYSQWYNDNPAEYGSPTSDGIVRIELDGDMFNQRNDKKAVPMDFFSTQFRNANADFKYQKKLDDVFIPKKNRNTSSKETQLNSISHFKDEIESRQDDMWYDDTDDKKGLRKNMHPTYVQNEDRFMTNTPDKIIGQDGYITDFSKYVTRVDVFLHNDSEENQIILDNLITSTQLGKEGKIHVKTDMKSFDRFKKDKNMRITEDYRQLYLPFDNNLAKPNHMQFIDYLEEIGKYGQLTPSGYEPTDDRDLCYKAGCDSFFFGYDEEPYDLDIEGWEMFLDEFNEEYDCNLTLDDIESPDDIDYLPNGRTKTMLVNAIIEKGEREISTLEDTIYIWNNNLIYVERAIEIASVNGRENDVFDTYQDNYGGIGKYWSYKKGGSDTYVEGGMFDNITTIIIKGYVDAKDVRWDCGYRLTGCGEYEIRLKSSGTVEVREIETCSGRKFPLKQPILLPI